MSALAQNRSTLSIRNLPERDYAGSSNLKAHQVYYYAVSAVDSSGNASTESSVVSITNS
jgi:hypothetical protein